MDISKLLDDNIILWIFYGFVSLVLFVAFFRKYRREKLFRTITSRKRGTKSERNLIYRLLKRGVHYRTIFHD